MTTEITQLSYDQPIRIPAWDAGIYARTFSVAGYARKTDRDPQAMIDRARRLGHDLYGSILPGMSLVNDGGRHARQEQEIAATAVTISDGEIVEIEGELVRVKVTRGNDCQFPRNSDPIKFQPVAGA